MWGTIVLTAVVTPVEADVEMGLAVNAEAEEVVIRTLAADDDNSDVGVDVSVGVVAISVVSVLGVGSRVTVDVGCELGWTPIYTFVAAYLKCVTIILASRFSPMRCNAWFPELPDL